MHQCATYLGDFILREIDRLQLVAQFLERVQVDGVDVAEMGGQMADSHRGQHRGESLQLVVFHLQVDDRLFRLLHVGKDATKLLEVDACKGFESRWHYQPEAIAIVDTYLRITTRVLW